MISRVTIDCNFFCIARVEPCAKFQQFKDPISEGFKHYLTLEDEKLPEPIEPVDEFFKTVNLLLT